MFAFPFAHGFYLDRECECEYDEYE